MAYHGYEPAKVAVEVGDGSITTAKIDADAVTAAKIADDVIAAEHYAAGSVDATALASNAVTTVKINADAVTNAKVADGEIDTEHLAADAVENAKIADNAVDTEHLADDAIEAAELASDAVVNASVASGAAIATSKISGALTSVGSHGLGSLATLSTVAAATITDNSVGADELNVSGDGSSGQALLSDADGTFSWGSGGDSNAGGANGSAGSPTFSFTSDPDTGMYRKDGNVLAFSTGGTERVSISDSLNVEGAFVMGSAAQFSEVARGLITIDFGSTNTITVPSAANHTFFLAFYKQTVNGNNSAVIGYVAIEDAAIQPSGFSVHHNLPGLSASSTSRTQIKLGNTAENSSAISVHYTIYKVGVDNS